MKYNDSSMRTLLGIQDAPEYSSFPTDNVGDVTTYEAKLLGFLVQPKYNERDNTYLKQACDDFNAATPETRAGIAIGLKGKVREIAILGHNGKQFSAGSQHFATFAPESNLVVKVKTETSDKIVDKDGKKKPFAVVESAHEK